MKVSNVLIVAALALTGLSGAVHAEEMAAAPAQEVKAQVAQAQEVKAVLVGNKVCPVSGEKIGNHPGMPPATYEYNGKLYNLCCSGCIQEFAKDPEKYSKIAEQEAMAAEGEMKDESAKNMPAQAEMKDEPAKEMPMDEKMPMEHKM